MAIYNKRMTSLYSKVKIIPIEQPFLVVLAQYFYEQFQTELPDFSNILVVFPTQRNKLYFRRNLLEVSRASGLVPPTMRTIAELIDKIYEDLGGKRGLMLNGVERNFILRKVVESLKVEYWHDLPFLRFVAIGKRLLHLYDELSREGISLEQVVELVRLGHYPERFVKQELTIIRNIFDEYRRTLVNLGYQDNIDKSNLILNRFTPDLLQPFKHILIAGFVATTHLETLLIQMILQELNAELILHSSSKRLIQANDPTNPFYLHVKMLKRIGVKKYDNITIIGHDKYEPPVIHIARTESMAQQMLHVKEIFHKIRSRYEPHRIAVILTDERNVFPMISIMKSSGLEFNLSTGLSMIQSSLYTFLEQLLNVVESGFHYKEFFIFIKHPLVKNAVIEENAVRSSVYTLQETMIKNRLNYFDFKEHPGSTTEKLTGLLKTCFDTVKCTTSLNQYILGLLRMLNNMLLYNKELMKTASRGIIDFSDSLIDLAKLRIAGDYIEPGIKMLRFILDVLKDASFRTRGDPMKGVQVIGLLEARNLDFDCIIIPSMNEGVFPVRSEKDLFVNQQVRKEIGLPYDKERESLFHYYFTEMLNAKKEVFITYIEEEKRDIRSRFIDFQIDEGAVLSDAKLTLSNPIRSTQRRSVEKSSDLFKVLIPKLATRGLSPTNLKDYRECPYRFYLRYVLGIKEPGTIVEEAGPMEWGRIMHVALRDFYKYDVPGGLVEEDITVMQLKLHQRLNKALRGELAVRPKMINFLDLEIYKKRMNRFLKKEIERSKLGYRVVTSEIEKQVKYFLQINNVKVRLYGYPDRIEIRDNRYYVLDYKSTIPLRKKYELGDDFVEFQLPLYGMIFAEGDFAKIGGLAYYGISGDVKITEIVEHGDVVRYLEDFKTKILRPTIEELLSPDVAFEQTPVKKSCTHCVFTHLCGVKSV